MRLGKGSPALPFEVPPVLAMRSILLLGLLGWGTPLAAQSAGDTGTLLACVGSILQTNDVHLERITPALLSRREVTDCINSPVTLMCLAFRAYRGARTAPRDTILLDRADSLFERALAHAESAAQRANFYAARAQRGYGDTASLIAACVAEDPTNGYCLFRRAGFIGDTVGRPTTVEGRAAYWCLADRYATVAELSDNLQIAASSRRAACQYVRAAPTARESYEQGWHIGERVTAPLGDGTCRTTVRHAPASWLGCAP